MRYVTAFVLFVAAVASVAQAAPRLKVTGTSFVAEHIADDGTVQAIETTRVPHVPDRSCYRWTVRVAPGEGAVRVHELFELPGRAMQWKVDDPARSTMLSPDRGAAVTALTLDRASGEITNQWCVAAGDPEGEYRISVVAGKQLLHRFVFTVGRARVA